MNIHTKVFIFLTLLVCGSLSAEIACTVITPTDSRDLGMQYQIRQGTDCNVIYNKGEGAEAEQALEEAAKTSLLVVGGSPTYLTFIQQLALSYPKVNFAVLSGSQTVFYPNQATNNVQQIWAKFYEGHYLNGIIAGNKTRSGHIGFISADSDSSTILNQNAFMLGLRKYRPDATMHVFYTKSYSDSDRAGNATIKLLEEVPQIDFIASDVYTAAPSRTAFQVSGNNGGTNGNIWAAGMFADASTFSGVNAVSSTLVDMAPVFNNLIQATVDDTFSFGITWYESFGLVSNGAPGILDFELTLAFVDPNVLSALKNQTDNEILEMQNGKNIFCGVEMMPINNNKTDCLSDPLIRDMKNLLPGIVITGSLDEKPIPTTEPEPIMPPAEKKDQGTQTVLIATVAALGSLIVLIAAPVVFFLYKRHDKTKKFKLAPPPDYSTVAFSSLQSSQQNTNLFSKKATSKIPSSVLLDIDFMNGLFALCDFTDISAELMTFYQFHGQGLDLLAALIKQEVENCQSAQTLFRETTVCSETFKQYTKIVGLKWLWKTFAPLIAEVRALGGKKDKSILAAKSLEVNPELIEAPEDEIINKLHLQVISQQFLNAIVRSTSTFPPELRLVCNTIRNEVERKYGDEKYKAVGAFVFLRFLCPAIIFPQESGLVNEPPEPQAQRFLLLVAKVLQNLANEVEFGEKETYMGKLNEFILTNLKTFHSFVDAISLESTLSSLDKKQSQCIQISQDMKSLSKRSICQFILTNKKMFTPEQLMTLNIESGDMNDSNHITVSVVSNAYDSDDE